MRFSHHSNNRNPTSPPNRFSLQKRRQRLPVLFWDGGEDVDDFGDSFQFSLFGDGVF